MMLRGHPLLKYHGVPSWPPVWVEKYGDRKLLGEIGELTHLGNLGPPGPLYLHMTYEATPYCGSLLIDDPVFRRSVYELLRKNIRSAIKDIGDLDVSATL